MSLPTITNSYIFNGLATLIILVQVAAYVNSYCSAESQQPCVIGVGQLSDWVDELKMDSAGRKSFELRMSDVQTCE
ncbi:hypothetical protein WN943_013809 [Citrus x changshan-huyou]